MLHLLWKDRIASRSLKGTEKYWVLKDEKSWNVIPLTEKKQEYTWSEHCVLCDCAFLIASRWCWFGCLQDYILHSKALEYRFLMLPYNFKLVFNTNTHNTGIHKHFTKLKNTVIIFNHALANSHKKKWSHPGRTIQHILSQPSEEQTL